MPLPSLVFTFSLRRFGITADKTGTLTCNVMDFRKCVVNGRRYGSGTTEIGLAALQRAGKPPPPSPTAEENSRSQIPYVNFRDETFFEDMDGKGGEQQQEKIKMFLLHLALCHTVIPEKTDDGEVRYSASSPDENALVSGAKFFGFEFVDRAPGVVRLQIMGVPVSYSLLEVIEFNSTRKRMSIIVQEPDGGRVIVLCKGADNVIFERLKNKDKEEQVVQESTSDHLESFAGEGLRTLVIASAVLDPKMYEAWHGKYEAAKNNLEQVQLKKAGKPNQIDDLSEIVESNLELLGATAIEDKLQDGVPDAIATLSKAGIKIWVLTGDKEETAINIGFACRLLDNDMTRVVINSTKHPTERDVINELKRQLYNASNAKGLETSIIRTESVFAPKKPSVFGRTDTGAGTDVSSKIESLTSFRLASSMFALDDDSVAIGADSRLSLVVDGASLAKIKSEKGKKYLLKFAQLCVAVIACRVSPKQKAEMVQLVEHNVEGVRTLAIGDGANDVAMIQAAHIGVGISGQEGMQAVNNSDYAIAQFRFLKRLLLVHGHWNYRRVSLMVLVQFYKNVLVAVPLFLFAAVSRFSGNFAYNLIWQNVYNLVKNHGEMWRM